MLILKELRLAIALGIFALACSLGFERLAQFVAFIPTQEGERVDLHFRISLPLRMLAIGSEIMGWKYLIKARRDPGFWLATLVLLLALADISRELYYVISIWSFNGQLAAH